MPFLPKIHFVDEMPKYIKDSANEGCLITGSFSHTSKNIYVLNRPKAKKVLIHELCHWFFLTFLFCKSPERWLHKWLDRHFTVLD